MAINGLIIYRMQRSGILFKQTIFLTFSNFFIFCVPDISKSNKVRKLFTYNLFKCQPDQPSVTSVSYACYSIIGAKNIQLFRDFYKEIYILLSYSTITLYLRRSGKILTKLIVRPNHRFLLFTYFYFTFFIIISQEITHVWKIMYCGYVK